MNSDSVTEPVGKTCTLVYEPHNRFPSERVFHGLTDDDVVFTVASLAGRRYRTVHHADDLMQLAASREAQMVKMAEEMIHRLYQGLGWWKRLLPMSVRSRIINRQMSYLQELTATWTGEIMGVHAELARATRPAPVVRARSAPENGPRQLCSQCEASTLLAGPLPKGWTKDSRGLPHCPEHPAVNLVKEPVG